ncbi:MAG: GerMN domain-containing protein [bacterium]|nr:GerMN domain-containing protein [bacterium]
MIAGAIQRAASAAIVVALLAAGCAPAPSEPTEPTPATPPPDAVVEPQDDTRPEDDADDTPAPNPLRREAVEVYFPAKNHDGLIGETRQIFHTSTPGDRVKQIVADLIAGPTAQRSLRAVPAGCQLRQAFVLDDGTVYLDFTGELVEGIGGGSMEELLTVYAIVDSVVLNVAEIRRAAILVNGSPVETLNGHTDLRRPLVPNVRLILGRSITKGGAPESPFAATGGVP